MLKIYQRSITYRKTREVEEFQKGAWMHLESPNESELKTAADTLKIELATLNDALDPYEAPRIEAENEGVYTFVRYPQNERTRQCSAYRSFHFRYCYFSIIFASRRRASGSIFRALPLRIFFITVTNFFYKT